MTRAVPSRRGILAALCLTFLTVHAAAPQPEHDVTTRALSAAEAGTILGRDVFDQDDKDVGQLVDVLVDKDGRPVAGVVDVGGFLGVGTRRVAVAWHLLRFVHGTDGTRIVMDLTLDTAAGAPEYLGSDNTLIVIDRPPP